VYTNKTLVFVTRKEEEEEKYQVSERKEVVRLNLTGHWLAIRPPYLCVSSVDRGPNFAPEI